MSVRFKFNLSSGDPARDLPENLSIGMLPDETQAHVLLRLFGYVLWYRERLEMEKNLHKEGIQFIPDLIQMDYTMQILFWGECGETNHDRLNRIAVKANLAEIWIIRRSFEEAEALHRDLVKHKSREGRYHIVGMDADCFEELLSLIQTRNDLFWLLGDYSTPNMQFSFNNVWFDVPFLYLKR